MKYNNILLAICIGFGFTFSTNSFSQCISDTNNIFEFSYQSKKYEIVKEKLNWINAAACAASRGGKLTEIDAQQEQDSIFYYVNQANITASQTVAPDGGGASYLWIGGNDLSTEGVWIWNGDNDSSFTQFWQGTKTGSAVGGLYNNWGNEPDNFNGQDALGLAFTNWPLGVAGEWNDVDETNLLYYIIEYPSISTSINKYKTTINFKLFPNPAQSILTVEMSKQSSSSSLEIYNLLGKKVKDNAINQFRTTVDLSDLESGVYFVKVINTLDYSQMQKLIIER